MRSPKQLASSERWSSKRGPAGVAWSRPRLLLGFDQRVGRPTEGARVGEECSKLGDLSAKGGELLLDREAPAEEVGARGAEDARDAVQLAKKASCFAPLPPGVGADGYVEGAAGVFLSHARELAGQLHAAGDAGGISIRAHGVVKGLVESVCAW